MVFQYLQMKIKRTLVDIAQGCVNEFFKVEGAGDKKGATVFLLTGLHTKNVFKE